jgi:hypothetical protein
VWTFGLALIQLPTIFGEVFASELIVAYDVSNNPVGSLNASEIGAGVTPLPLSRGSGIVRGNTGSYDGTQFTTANTPDPNDYFEWGWSSSGPRDLTTLDIAYRRANTNGPRILRIDLSANGQPYQTVFTDNDINSTANVIGEANTIDVSAFDGVTSAVFRLFAWDSPGTSGSQLEIKNNPALGSLRGIAVYAVPEPSSLCPLLVAFGGWLTKRRRSVNT